MYRRILFLGALALAWAGSLACAQPIITLQPLNVLNQLLGDTVTFSGAAVSPVTTNLQYQWLRNGVPIPNATNVTLTMNSVQATNCGAFSLRVSDGQDVAVSASADLTVNILQLVGKLLGLVDLSGQVRSSTVGASKSAGEPVIVPGDPGGNSIWFKWTPLLSGIVTFKTLGSDFDTIMGAYTGTPPSGLVKVPSAYNDDDGAGYLNSQVTFNAQALTTYVIVVDGYYGASGNVVLSWQEDLSLDKLPAVETVLPSALTVSNGASVTVPSPWGQACDWYFNGELMGAAKASLVITNFGDGAVGSYVAQISTQDGHTSTSQPMRAQIDVLQNGTTATNSFAWNKFLDAANFAFTPPAGQQLSVQKMGGGDTGGYNISQTYSTVGNTEEPGEPSICGQLGGHPSWFSYVTPSRGAMLITTSGSTFNTQLAVYIGPGNNFTTLTNLGCGYTTNYRANGQPVIYLPEQPAHQTNYIVVDGQNGASGTVSLNVTLGNPVTVLTPPQSQAVLLGSNVTFTISATGGTSLGYFWEFNGVAIPGANTSTLKVNNAQASSAGTYTAFVTNSVSFVSSSAVLSFIQAPAIAVQPVSQTVSAGGTAALSVTASGAPSPVYQWFVNGASTGANSSQLIISNFQSANQGSYSVAVSNVAGVVSSAPSLLLLNGPARINSYRQTNGVFQLQLAATAGSNYVIQCSPDLIHWTPLFTNIALNGFVEFSDTNASALRCFYRGVVR